MRAYLIWDDDPDGGHLSIQNWKPDLSVERPSVLAVREIDIEESLWDSIMRGEIEINVEDPYSLDHILMPLWNKAGT